MKTKLIFLIAFFYTSQNIQAQKQLDSIRHALQQAKNPQQKTFTLAYFSVYLSGTKADSAMMLARQGVELSKRINSDSGLANCYKSVGWCYYCLGKNDSAVSYTVLAQKLFHKLNDAKGEGSCLLNLGTVYNQTHNYTNSLNCLIAARPLLEKAGDEVMLAYHDRTIAVVYREQGLYKEAGNHLLSAIHAFKKLNITNYLGDTYTSYGTVLFYQKNIDSALYYYRSAYNIFKNTPGNSASLAYSAEDIGAAFYRKADDKPVHPWVDSAYRYFTIALNTFSKLGSAENVQYEHLNLGQLLSDLKKYNTATQYLTQAFHYFDSVHNFAQCINATNALSALYKSKGDYRNAYEYSQLYDNYRDTFNAQNRADSIARLLGQYETDKRDRTIQLLNAQAKIDEQEISSQHVIEWFSIISVILAGILLIVLVNRARIKQQLKEVRVRNQLAGDLHDEVGSSLSSILLLSKMGAGNTVNEGENKNMYERIAGNTKEVIDKMSDIVWMMNPKYDDGENLRERLEQYKTRIKGIAPFNISSTIAAEIDGIKFSMEMRKSVFLIFKEAINNATKYSEATEMNIQLSIAHKMLVLKIEDNGKGFDKSSIEEGNGMELMALRAKNCNGTCIINSAPGKGTSIEVQLPLPHSR